MIKTTKQYAILINLEYPEVWTALLCRDIIFGFIPVNRWRTHSLPSKELDFIRKYLTDNQIRKIKHIVIE